MAAPAQVTATYHPVNGLDGESNRLPADPAAALALLRQKAHALAAEPMSAAQRFSALEAMRGSALELSEKGRPLYWGKPNPLAPAERQGWEDSVGLWQAFYFAYALCADAGLDPQWAATVSQRALDSLGRAIREHAFAYRAVPGALWKELHSCYRSALACSLTETAVEDARQPQSQISCKASYLATVLHDCANLYALSAMQMRVVQQWLPGWLGAVDLTSSVPVWASRSPLALDLDGDAGASLARDIGGGEWVRYLDTSALGMRLRELAECLRNARPAAELDAVADAPRATLERLLTHLYVQWCSAGSGRVDERHGSASRAQVALSMHAIHFQISGRAFRQPGLRYTREEDHDLATFGHITERTEHRLLTGRSAALEPWEIVNQSASGLLGMRRKRDLESRIAHGQLVAMRTSSIDPPSLAVVQRLRGDADGELNVGVRVVRGELRGVAVRAAGDSAQKYERALLIEADGEHAGPASLIVGAGRFAPGARVELYTSRAETIKIEQLIERSVDFDRVTFVQA